MFRTIVAGCNGRERGRGAVSLAHAIATATGAKLLLVGAHHNPPLPFPSSYAAQRHELEHDLRAVRDELAPEAIIQIHADMSPAHALRHVARYEGADLLVVGSRHRRRLQHIAEGDHAMQVLHGARCAVAIAPDPLAPRPELRRIGVGIDATPESAVALGMACDLGQRTGARLRLVAVADDGVSPWWGDAPTPLDEQTLQEIAEQRVTAARALLAERLGLCEGIEGRGDVVVGNPAGELILASEDLDLLVLGSRRWGPVKRLALGSTSEQVIRHTACPVLVPRRGAAGIPPRRPHCRRRGRRQMSVFERIVVGIDGRCGGRDALALAALLQRVCGGEVTVGLESGEQARTRAARAGALLRRRCRWESRAVPARSVEEGLLAGAAAERAVAIVVGSSRRRRGRRTVGERLVRRTADCAVTIAPLGYGARVNGLLDAHTALR